jgi:hypothetical protein
VANRFVANSKSGILNSSANELRLGQAVLLWGVLGFVPSIMLCLDFAALANLIIF